MEEFNSYKISMILNYMIFIFTIIASIIMFTGFKFMNGVEPELESSSIGMFCFFTVDSNLLMGIISLIMANKERMVLIGKNKSIPKFYYILKMVGTISVSLTFLVVIAYLGPLCPGGIMSLLQNSNLFFHLVIPILSIIAFCFFERTDVIKFKNALYGLLPIFIYGAFYLINVLSHIENGKVLVKYDWYLFVQSGLYQIYIVIPIIFFITFIIGIIIWVVNKKG